CPSSGLPIWWRTRRRSAERGSRPPASRARPKERIDPCVACARRASQIEHPAHRQARALSYFARSRKVPQAYVALPQNVREFEREPDADKLASTPVAIAAIGLKRRQAD